MSEGDGATRGDVDPSDENPRRRCFIGPSALCAGSTVLSAGSAPWLAHETTRRRLRYGDKLPCVDIFVCTADPHSEPPSLVISTVLSVMAYNYPTEKLSVYLSDDGGSILTFYALWEASQFAKHWLPFCRRYNIEPRSPAAYFSGSDKPRDMCSTEQWSFVKDLYKEMTERIDHAVILGKVPEEIKVKHKGFNEWNSGITSSDHHPIVQVLIDGKDSNAVDNEGSVLPTLAYMAREKRPQYHHNFKAGAMNALIRVSSVISNSPIILNVDCDVYSNSSDSIRDALCFFLDEEMGHKVGYVQYPQSFNNMTRNDIYANSFSVINEVELSGMDSVGCPAYVGTGCFHRREILCGREFSKDYKEDWNRGVTAKAREHQQIDEIEEKAKSLVTCTYENNTQWGDEIGLKYGFSVEDFVTGLAIQCRGWESVYMNPQRKAFTGLAPTTLARTLLQHKRWSEGTLSVFLSKYCPLLFGHGKIKLRLQMGYCIYGLWAPNSLPTLYYVTVPSLCLLKSIPLFPEITSPWVTPFVYVPIATYIYSLYESLSSGVTFRGWWNDQRMWMIRRITCYLLAIVDTFLRLLGPSTVSFSVTPKVSHDEDESRRYEQDVMEFDRQSSSAEFVAIAAVALLNLVCLVSGLSSWIVATGSNARLFFVQIVLCAALVAANIPIYKAMFARKDRGSLSSSVTLVSIGFVLLIFLIPAA